MINEKMINENTSDTKNGKVIAIVANKGGTGKSTLALHFSYFLQMKNYKVLLIELDANRTLSSILEAEEKKAMIFRKIFKEIDDNIEIMLYNEETFDTEEISIEKLVSNTAIFDVCVNHNEKYNLDFIGSSIRFNLDNDSVLKRIMTNSKSYNIYYLSKILDYYRLKYDFIIIDTNNAINDWWKEVLVSSDYCLSPFVGTENPKVTRGCFQNTMEFIDNFNEASKTDSTFKKVKFLGVIVNRCNNGSAATRQHLKENLKIYGKKRFSYNLSESSSITGDYEKPLLSQRGAGEKPARPLKKLFNEIYEKIK